MHVIAAEPQFYSILVEQGSLQILLQLLSHENADIVGAVCNLLQVKFSEKNFSIKFF